MTACHIQKNWDYIVSANRHSQNTDFWAKYNTFTRVKDLTVHSIRLRIIYLTYICVHLKQNMLNIYCLAVHKGHEHLL